MPPRVMPGRMHAAAERRKSSHSNVHEAIAHADANDKAERALEVVRELHKRYQAQDERWHNYLKLIGFIGFSALLLSVLYLQRDAHILYQVHSTIAAGVLPDPDTISSPKDVLSWLKDFLKQTWVDPACGDGLCESPFEFASYGRFGCRADCGRLADTVENLTTIQIDLKFDFSHPAGSIPSSELMSQAHWNLCPENGAPHGRDCYWAEDRTFDRIEGSLQEVIDDVPDGLWTIKVKRDFFGKVRGAVRVRDLVELQARHYSKIHVALEAAEAHHAYELDVLQGAVDLARTPLATLVSDVITTETNAVFLDLQVQLQAGAITQTEHDSAEADVRAYMADMATNIARRGKCPGLASYNYPGYPATGPRAEDVIPADALWAADIGAGADLLAVTLTPPAGTALTYNDMLPGGTSPCDAACVCTKLETLAEAQYTARFTTMQDDLIARLDRNKGRLGAQKARKLELLKDILDTRPELYEFIVDLSTGLEPLTKPDVATLDGVIAIYVEGPLAYGVDGRPNVADSLLKRTTILELDAATDPNAMGTLVERCQARSDEIVSIRDEVSRLPAVQRVNALLAANDNKILAVEYTIAAWHGSSEHFNYCELQARAPAYDGACTARMPYTLTSVETAPYACSAFANGTTLAGAACQSQIDRQLDCDSMCECVAPAAIPGAVDRGCAEAECAAPFLQCPICGVQCSTAAGSEIVCRVFVTQFKARYCTCPRCEGLPDAALDDEFLSIRETFTTNAATGRRLAELVAEQHEARVAQGRKLQQLSEETVDKLLVSVNSLRESQSGLTTQVTTLSTQVKEANAAAEERAADTTLQDLIQAGRQDILLGQQRVESLLAQIIGKQNQALAAAEQAEAAVQAIAYLSDKRLEASAGVTAQTEEQLSAIKQAAQQALINEPQALVLWKRARRERESQLKRAVLSNSACSTERVETHDFEVDNYEDVALDTARERLIGLTNRVIGGVLLHTTRMAYARCEDSRFAKIENNCASGTSIEPYGVDPVFVMGSTLFDPDLDNEKSLLHFYNCSEIPEAQRVYNLEDPYSSSGALVNEPPYCANLFNMRDAPLGFHHHALEGKPDGFPVWIDINLSEDEAQRWYTHLEEGLMLDVLTREMTADLVTYNAELRMFSSVFVRFRFTDGGSIAVTYKLHTIRVELYSEMRDYVRLGLELVFAACVLTTAVYQLKGIYKAWAETRQPLAYFSSGWTWVGLSSTALMITSNIVWWTFVLRHVKNFDIDIRYDVYADPNAQARISRLNGDGEELARGYAAFSSLQFLVQTLSWYYALHGINILLVIARILNLMHFQPRLGVVTRSLLLAGPDLLHFTVVAGIVFVGYAMMAHVIFGNVIEKFSTFRLAIDTCFEMLLGEISVNEELKALTGLQGLAGSLFFWTFELLVFMVLLNFLLAIIVDAFSVVKDNTSESTGLHEELAQMAREKWRAVLGRMLNVHYIPSSRLSTLLKHWAGSDLDELKTRKAAGDEAQKRIKVLDHELQEGELRDVLGEAMQGMIAGENNLHVENSGGKRKGGAAAAGALTPQELESATKWLMERFGYDGSDDESGSDDDAAEEGRYSEEALEKERDALAKALERLATVQRELAMGQHELMSGQKALAEQQDKLVQFLEAPFDEDEGAAPSPAQASPMEPFQEAGAPQARASRVMWQQRDGSESDA